MLADGEVLIKKSEQLDVGEVYDVYCLKELTPDQLQLLTKGETPEGLVVYEI